MQYRKSHTIDIFFVVSLFALYVLSSLFLSVIGADVYRENVTLSEANYNVRTSVLYLTEKVRQNETGGDVRSDSFGGHDALVLSEHYNGNTYETWIYIEDGYLCEVYLAANVSPMPGIGQKIMEVNALTVTSDNMGLLTIGITDKNDNSYSSRVYLECFDGGGDNAN